LNGASDSACSNSICDNSYFATRKNCKAFKANEVKKAAAEKAAAIKKAADERAAAIKKAAATKATALEADQGKTKKEAEAQLAKL